MNDYSKPLESALSAATAAGDMLRSAFHAGENNGDTRAEQQIRRVLLGGYPTYGYLGEELGFTAGSDPEEHLWLVDPDDGTSAFEEGFRGAAVSIALLRAGRPVLGVVYAYCAPDDDGDLFAWAEGAGPVRRNGTELTPLSAAPETILVSHKADRNPLANAKLAGPARFRSVPSIAYRLALVAAGEARAAASLNGPVGWDYAGGHALLLGAGMDLCDDRGEPVRYDRQGHSGCGGRCFGGPGDLARSLAQRDWSPVFGRAAHTDEPLRFCWPKRGQSVADSGVLSRAQGCMLGQLAGDALGSLVEFQRASSIRAAYPKGVRSLADGGTFDTIAGQPTDDSEMALALARSILERGGYDAEGAARAYASWYESRPFDCGATIRAAASAASGAGPGQSAAERARGAGLRDSQSNGALMRVSPLGLLGAGVPEGAAGAWACADAALTHPNPVCLTANAVFAEALAFAIRTGGAASAVYDFALSVAHRADSASTVVAALEKAASAPPDDYSRQQGWVLIALQNAFWQLLHAGCLEEAVVDTVMRGGDTDTNAAIAGALAGAVWGRKAVPRQWVDRVLTCRPIADLAGVHQPRPQGFWPVDALYLAERIVWLGSAQSTRPVEGAAAARG